MLITDPRYGLGIYIRQPFPIQNSRSCHGRCYPAETTDTIFADSIEIHCDARHGNGS